MSLGPNERLEQSQWDFFWVPDDVEIVDRPEVAALRSPRPLPHFNIVTRTREEPSRIDALVREMCGAFAHDVARWLVTDTFERAPLEAALQSVGWAPHGHYESRAIRPSDYRRTPPAGFEVRRVSTLETLRDCLTITGTAFGHPREHTDAELRFELAQCNAPAARVQRYVVYRDGEPVCSGGLNAYPDLAFAFLWAGGTIPSARGAGAYTALVEARIRAARALGAEWVGLYAKDDTSAPIVARQGLERFGEMTYWAPAPRA